MNRKATFNPHYFALQNSPICAPQNQLEVGDEFPYNEHQLSFVRIFNVKN